MENGSPSIVLKKDWALANPWLWLIVGFGLTLWSMLWAQMFGVQASDYRVLVLAFGLLVASIGIWMRLRDKETVHLPAMHPALALGARFLTGATYGLLAILLSSLFVATLIPADYLTHSTSNALLLSVGALVAHSIAVFLGADGDDNRPILSNRSIWIVILRLAGVVALAFGIAYYFDLRRWGIQTGGMFLVVISTVPVCYFAAQQYLRRKPDQPMLEVSEEAGIVLAFAAGTCFVGTYTLYVGSDLPTDWDTLRMALRVLTAVALAAGALAAVASAIRRLAISVLIVLHFAAISTACLAAPPSPWIVQQTWVRLFRPYLEFMYLNNAYHFYAPEPGPASYLWFRVIHTTPIGQSGFFSRERMQDFGTWYKVPHLDEDGHLDHAVALEYQRFLTLTESVSGYDSPPTEMYFNKEINQWDWHPFWRNRLNLVPVDNRPIIVGQELTTQLQIPTHPAIPQGQQVFIPNHGSRLLFSSYARFVARKFEKHPDHPDWQVKSVKVYKVIHFIPHVMWYQNHLPPTDPELYRPYYVGNYDSAGQLINEQDPYLYWLLPVLRDRGNDPDSTIKDHARRHAGDPNWVRDGRTKAWGPPLR